LKPSARKLLEEVARVAEESHPDLEVTCEVFDGGAKEMLEGPWDDVQLLVVGARRAHRLPERLLGWTSLHAAATARCPVVVVPEDPYAGLSVRGDGQVLLGMDGLDAARDLVGLRVRDSGARGRSSAGRARLAPTGGADEAYPFGDEGRVTAEQDMRLHRTLGPWQARYPEVELAPRDRPCGCRPRSRAAVAPGPPRRGRTARPSDRAARAPGVGQPAAHPERPLPDRRHPDP
jgi:hypothetical protein